MPNRQPLVAMGCPSIDALSTRHSVASAASVISGSMARSNAAAGCIYHDRGLSTPLQSSSIPICIGRPAWTVSGGVGRIAKDCRNARSIPAASNAPPATRWRSNMSTGFHCV